LGADGNHNGVVDAADYVIWRKHVSMGVGAVAVANAVAQESEAVVFESSSSGVSPRVYLPGPFRRIDGIVARLPGTAAHVAGPARDEALLALFAARDDRDRRFKSAEDVAGAEAPAEPDGVFAELNAGWFTFFEATS
jgi:hypothetical protein